MEESMMIHTSMATVENMAKKDNQQQEIAAMKGKRLSFKKRKACIKKKTMELSVLCDVEACAVIIDSNGEVETWPENQSAVLKIIGRYKDCLHAADNKKMVKNEYTCDYNNLLNDHQWEWNESMYNGLSTESLEDLLNISVCGDDKNQNKAWNLHSWDDRLIDGLPIELLQDVLRELDSKLEAVAKRIKVSKMADDHKSNNGKEVALWDEVPRQNIQTLNSSSGAMRLFGGEPNQQMIHAPYFGWFEDGSSFYFNNIMGSTSVHVAEDSNNHQKEQPFIGASEQGIFNMWCREQPIQTPWFFAEESHHSLSNMAPGMYPPHQFGTMGLCSFSEPKFSEQSTFAVGQPRRSNYDHSNNL